VYNDVNTFILYRVIHLRAHPPVSSFFFLTTDILSSHHFKSVWHGILLSYRLTYSYIVRHLDFILPFSCHVRKFIFFFKREPTLFTARIHFNADDFFFFTIRRKYRNRNSNQYSHRNAPKATVLNDGLTKI